MALPVGYRKAARETVEAAVLSISGGTEYVNTITEVHPALLTAEQVEPHRTPWVTVYAGDSSWTDADVDLGTKKLRIDVVVAAILRPDPARDGGVPLPRKMEDYVQDLEKAIELHAQAYQLNGVTCSRMANMQVGVSVDDQGAFAIVETVVTYEAFGVIGQ